MCGSAGSEASMRMVEAADGALSGSKMWCRTVESLGVRGWGAIVVVDWLLCFGAWGTGRDW